MSDRMLLQACLSLEEFCTSFDVAWKRTCVDFAVEMSTHVDTHLLLLVTLKAAKVALKTLDLKMNCIMMPLKVLLSSECVLALMAEEVLLSAGHSFASQFTFLSLPWASSFLRLRFLRSLHRLILEPADKLVL